MTTTNPKPCFFLTTLDHMCKTALRVAFCFQVSYVQMFFVVHSIIVVLLSKQPNDIIGGKLYEHVIPNVKIIVIQIEGVVYSNLGGTFSHLHFENAMREASLIWLPIFIVYKVLGVVQRVYM